jgi:two-component system, NarL family, response regulator DegU
VRTVRVLVADDHETVRRGLCEILSTRADLAICAQAGDGQEAVDRARETKPDLVILDITMPKRDGFTAAREIRKLLPNIRILMFSMHDGVSFVQTAKKVGANGFVAKTDPSEVLLDAVDAVVRGEDFFSTERMDSAERLRKRRRPNVA